MAIDFKPLTAAFIAVLLMVPCAQAQTVSASEALPRADLYARLKVAGFTMPVELRQSGMKTRIDLTAGGVLQSYIADREKGVLISLTATGQNRTALVFPLDRADGVIPLPLDLAVLVRQARLKVVGASLVGGRSCRLIEFSNYLNQSGMICANADNVILQMTKKGQPVPLFEVVDLVMGKPDAKWFRTPPDYQVAVVPGIGGASASVVSDEGRAIATSPPPVSSVKPPSAR